MFFRRKLVKVIAWRRQIGVQIAKLMAEISFVIIYRRYHLHNIRVRKAQNFFFFFLHNYYTSDSCYLTCACFILFFKETRREEEPEQFF